MENNYILAINPGSTSTKVAVSIGTKQVFLRSVLHTAKDLEKFEKITDQFEFRKELVLKEVRENGIPFERITIVIGRGGLVKPILSGVYEVNKELIQDLHDGVQGEHEVTWGD